MILTRTSLVGVADFYLLPAAVRCLKFNYCFLGGILLDQFILGCLQVRQACRCVAKGPRRAESLPDNLDQKHPNPFHASSCGIPGTLLAQCL
jgi:hypothetical protein